MIPNTTKYIQIGISIIPFTSPRQIVQALFVKMYAGKKEICLLKKESTSENDSRIRRERTAQSGT